MSSTVVHMSMSRDGWPTVHHVSDLDAAVRDARHAAGDRNVLVHGAGVIAQRALTAGLLDEILTR